MPLEVAAALANAIADTNGVEPTNLGYALENHIPIEAIRLLVEHETTTWTLRFALPDHDVTITSDETILVDGTRKEFIA